MPGMSKDVLDRPNWDLILLKVVTMPSSLSMSTLAFLPPGVEHLGLLASGRGEHDVGIGVIGGAHGEAPGEVVGAVAGGDALTDVDRRHRHGHGHPHLRAASCPAASNSSTADFVELEETLYGFPLNQQSSSPD